MRLLKFVGKVLLVLIVMLGCIYILGKNISNAYSQEDYQSGKPSRIVPVTQWAEQEVYADSLEYLYGRNKIIPTEYKNQILLALAHYPELTNVNIEFIVEPSLIPIASRPKPSTIFHAKANRWYCIVISNDGLDEMEYALLENLSFNAQIGVIGHELGHTLYYMDRSSSNLIGLALAYPFSKFQQKFEKETDLRTIDHGLGWQLLQWAEEIRKGESSEFLDSSYLTPAEIKKVMEISGRY